MLKIMTILGTRPEIIKMSRVINIFDHYTKHILVHTGQNYDYELNEIFFNELEIRKPDYFLNVASSTACKMIAQVIIQSEEVLRKESPDALMLYGDTNSCLSAIAAKKLKVPIFHMEAGNRCFDLNVPEETNRKIVDHLSDINLVLTEHARRYLISEGFAQERIIKTGSHMNEVISFYMDKIKESQILNTLNLSEKKYLLASIHREENVDVKKNLLTIIEALQNLSELYDLPVLVSTHPRTSMRIKEAKLNLSSLKRISFIKPLGFIDYTQLQLNSFCTLSDSGTITEEASLLNFPAVTIRNAHERPEGMDSGVLIMTGLTSKNIVESVKVTVQTHNQKVKNPEIVPDYISGQVSQKVLNIVQSYTEYVNRKVWCNY